jgi:hypothetical protein
MPLRRTLKVARDRIGVPLIEYFPYSFLVA